MVVRSFRVTYLPLGRHLLCFTTWNAVLRFGDTGAGGMLWTCSPRSGGAQVDSCCCGSFPPSLPILFPLHPSLQAFLKKKKKEKMASVLLPRMSAPASVFHAGSSGLPGPREAQHGRRWRKAVQVSPSLAPGRRSSGGAVFQGSSSALRSPPGVSALSSPPSSTLSPPPATAKTKGPRGRNRPRTGDIVALGSRPEPPAWG